MASKKDICRKIEELIPEAGRCGIDFQVEYDDANHCWSVDLQEGDHHMRTFVEEFEAEDCLGKEKCIPLGLQIGQLKDNLKLYHDATTSKIL